MAFLRVEGQLGNITICTRKMDLSLSFAWMCPTTAMAVLCLKILLSEYSKSQGFWAQMCTAAYLEASPPSRRSHCSSNVHCSCCFPEMVTDRSKAFKARPDNVFEDHLIWILNFHLLEIASL